MRAGERVEQVVEPRPGEERMPLSSITIVGFDGSGATHVAVRFAVLLGRALHGYVVAVTGHAAAGRARRQRVPPPRGATRAR
jgi:hypothetical protein